VRLTHADRGIGLHPPGVSSESSKSAAGLVAVAEKLEAWESKVQIVRDKLSEREAIWEALKAKVSFLAEQAKGKVSLDVGGQIFSTTHKSLSSCEFFSAMTSRWESDEDGHYFIDRVRQAFSLIKFCTFN
jgi:hypothetical protein